MTPLQLFILFLIGVITGAIVGKKIFKFSEMTTDKCVEYLQEKGFSVRLYKQRDYIREEI